MEKIKNIYNKILQNKKNIIAGFVVLVIVAVIFSLFSEKNKEMYAIDSTRGHKTAQGYPGGLVESDMEMDMVEEKAYTQNFAEKVSGSDAASYLENRKVIKNANLSLTVKNLSDSRKNIEDIVAKNSGYISNIRANNYSYEKRLNITAKVPNKTFYNVNQEVKSQKGVEKVNSENISLQDVTKRYTDLELRIKNKKTEEEQYRQIMKKAVKIEDILKVTNALNKVRNEIERLEISFKNLDQQVSFSTLDIELISVVDKKIEGEVWSPTTEIKIAFENLKNNLKDLYSEILNFVAKLPIYIFYLIILLIGFKILKLLFRFVKSKL